MFQTKKKARSNMPGRKEARSSESYTQAEERLFILVFFLVIQDQSLKAIFNLSFYENENNHFFLKPKFLFEKLKLLNFAFCRDDIGTKIYLKTKAKNRIISYLKRHFFLIDI
jgi:hypothetical protein